MRTLALVLLLGASAAMAQTKGIRPVTVKDSSSNFVAMTTGK